MKTILLLRHAKSSHDDLSLKDIDRPLAKGGRREALRMGSFIKEVGALPAAIISSPAKRAEQTTRLFVSSAGIDPTLIQRDDDLYYGGARDYLSAIQHASDSVEGILLVGHNPLMEETVSLLCNGEGSYMVRMPTAALVCIEHPAIKGDQIKGGTARLKWMVIPELLKKMEIVR